VADLPDISLLTPYATFGNFLNDQNVTINGNVGIGNNGTLKLESPSTITGNLDLGIGATTGGGGFPANVTGTITTGVDFTAAQNQVQSASTALAGLTPNTTLVNVTSGQSFGAVNGIADVFVVNVSSIALGSGENLTFSGDAGDIFVLNVSGDVDMSGDAAISALSQASYVLINLTTGASLGNVAHIGNVINGTTLIPDATYAEFHSVNGAIFGGLGEIKLMSGAKVESVPFQPPTVPDAGSTMVLMSIGLGCLAAAKRKFIS
jgi:choice-of-anchor A domain-containing protein